MPSHTVRVPFGGKKSLIGFHNKRGEFVVVHNAHIIGFYNNRGEFVPVHNIPLIRAERSARRNEVTNPIHPNPPDFQRQDLLELSKRGRRLDLHQVSPRPARPPLRRQLGESTSTVRAGHPSSDGRSDQDLSLS
jgi:hypothetical protein